uniref:HTH psq-type domain-containing protein n=1 Tax=Anopheles atroparvus TaxID=41427 RepID=A0A182J0W7_ANOAO
LRTAEQLKIKGLCEVGEPQYEQDYSPAVKRYKPYRSRSPPDNRHSQHHHHQQPPPPPPPASGASGATSSAGGGGRTSGSGGGANTTNSNSNTSGSSSSQSTGYSENGKSGGKGGGGTTARGGGSERSHYHPSQQQHHSLHHHHPHLQHPHHPHHHPAHQHLHHHLAGEDDDGSPSSVVVVETHDLTTTGPSASSATKDKLYHLQQQHHQHPHQHHHHHHRPPSSSSSSQQPQQIGGKMASLGMGVGINGSVMGVPMGYLDFAPEPPAPTATPVTEHVDINCAPSSHDTRDLSSKYSVPNDGDLRVKFETLRSLDPPNSVQLDNQAVAHQQQQQQLHHQQQQAQQQQQRQTPQPAGAPAQQNDHQRNSPPHIQQQAQQQQHVMMVDQQQQHHPTTHSPASSVSSSSSSQHPENLVTGSGGAGGGGGGSVTPGPTNNNNSSNGAGGDEMKSRLNLKQEIITDAAEQQQQQQTMEVEQDQSSMHGMVVTPEISGIMNQSQMSDMYQSDASEDSKAGILDGSAMQYTNLTSPNEAKTPTGPKTWTAEDMESALEALRTHNMSLTKASATYGIPSTTLWQRAHRLGIDTPKKEGPSKTWNEDSLNSALEALRTGTISANKASKAFGIPSSTLYKIARREGIRLAAPFNAAPTTWSAEDLDRALEAIRAGQTSVQKASTEFGIPTGTLYGRCKREGIELSRSNPTPWSEDAMMEALESVNSLYGRFKRGKYDTPSSGGGGGGGGSSTSATAAAAATGGGGGGGAGAGGGSSNVGGSPQMEFKIEPQQNDHSPENTVNYSYY